MSENGCSLLDCAFAGFLLAFVDFSEIKTFDPNDIVMITVPEMPPAVGYAGMRDRVREN
jgi:hypothetical protein